MFTVKHGQSSRLVAWTMGTLLSACSLGQSTGGSTEDADEDTVPAQQQAAVTASKIQAPSRTAAAKPGSTAAAPGKTPAKTASKPLTAAKAPAAAAMAASPATVKASPPRASARASEEKVVRFVLADVLNVHMSPRQDAPVVAKLARGSMFTVMYQGEWAKIGDGQFVLSRYLSRTQVAANGTKLAARK